eukprot:4628332-Amphidinium_carterae.1
MVTRGTQAFAWEHAYFFWLENNPERWLSGQSARHSDPSGLPSSGFQAAKLSGNASYVHAGIWGLARTARVEERDVRIEQPSTSDHDSERLCGTPQNALAKL